MVLISASRRFRSEVGCIGPALHVVFVRDNGEGGGLGVLLDVQRSESRPPFLENIWCPFQRGGQG